MEGAATLTLLGHLLNGTRSPRDVTGAHWADVTNAARRHGLGACLYHTLRHGDEGTPPEVLRGLKWAYLRTAAASLVLERECLHIDAALSAAGIPALWIKGIALAWLVYPETGLRPMVDLDLLVPRERLNAAGRKIEALGYGPCTSDGILMQPDDPLFEMFSNHYIYSGGPKGAVQVELHHRLFPHHQYLELEDLDAWCWENIIGIERSGQTIATFNPEAYFIYLIHHALVQHGDGDFSLLRYWDMHLLATAGRFDWDRVLRDGERLRLSQPVAIAVERLRLYFDTPIPDQVFEELRRLTGDYRATSPIGTSSLPSEWRSGRAMESMKGFTPRQKIRFLLRHLVPPPSYMRLHHGGGRPAALFNLYLDRWLSRGQDLWGWVTERVRRSILTSR
jgi:hypothetical protein